MNNAFFAKSALTFFCPEIPANVSFHQFLSSNLWWVLKQPFTFLQKHPPTIFSLVAELQVYQQAYPHTAIHQQSYLKTSIEPFDFSWEWKADLHSSNIATMNLLCIHLHNELVLFNIVDGFLWANGKAQ